MKTSLSHDFCTCIFAFPLAAQAAVWRVDSIPGHPADFTTITAAINSTEVQEGDTLVLQGDFTGETTTLNRKLHLVGYGYYHAENGYNFPAGTTLEARLGAVSIEPGSATRADGSSITGCVTGEITINDAANILIRRNKIIRIVLEGSDDQSARGITIAQNFFIGAYTSYVSTIQFSATRSIGDVLITGNLIPRSGHTYYWGWAITTTADDSVTIVNNVLDNVSILGYGAFQNNVTRISPGTFSTWITVKNNLSTGGAILPVGNGNINSVASADVFELNASPDGQFQLKAGSPAIGAGADGYDIGMFSGPMPYILSGLPPVPMITQLQLPPVVQDGTDVPVTIRAEVKQ